MDNRIVKKIFLEMHGIDYKKEETHRALDDIYGSIAEPRSYLTHVKWPLRLSISNLNKFLK
jgi:oligoribonuclease (3'-5' exoribonuclease)